MEFVFALYVKFLHLHKHLLTAIKDSCCGEKTAWGRGVVGTKPSAKVHAKFSKLAVSIPTSLLIWEEIGSYNINPAVPVAKIQMLDVKSQVESAPRL